MFQLEPQKLDQWCWAAVSLSVQRYFSGGNGSSQCEIAHDVLHMDCCRDSGPCNRPAFLEDALDAVRVRHDPFAGSLSFAQIKQQIDDGLPICVRIGWFGGGGHFVIIRGYRDPAGAEILNIADPWFVDSMQDCDAFTSNYLGRGEWTHTYKLMRSAG